MYPKRHLPIIIAVALSIVIIGFSYWAVNKEDNPQTDNPQTEDQGVDLSLVRRIHEGDHVLGNPNAQVVFYVYSDFSCAYCKSYHKTMRTIMNLYGQEGNVAWVFRHIPYVQLHPESPMYALASECVAQDKGDSSFWRFTDLLYEKVDPLEPLSAAEMVLLAEQVGVTKQSFVTCMRSNELMKEVTTDFEEAVAVGANGSPFTILEVEGERTAYQGAQDFRVLAIALQEYTRTSNITELDSPGTATEGENSFTKEFENLDIEPTATSTENTTLDGVTES